MSLTKENILKETTAGLDIFKYFIRGKWRVGKPFLNPFYNDTKASCYVYFDNGTKTYKVKDFGNADFASSIELRFLPGYPRLHCACLCTSIEWHCPTF